MIKNRKIRVFVVVLLILAFVLTSVVLTFGNANIFESAQAAALSQGTASVLNLNDKGEANDNFSGVITGEQNEYIYFGSQSDAAIKWRVLTTTANTYSSGNWLLWADASLGDERYNYLLRDNPNYAYWSTSLIRAALNGGNYLGTVNNSTSMPAFNLEVEKNDSYFKTLFNTIEQANMVATGRYETKDWGYDADHSVPKIYTTGLVGNGLGQYSRTNVSSMNTLAGSAATISVSGTSVKEETSGDYLFLIDYYDINNTAFGFGDANVVCK